VRTLVVLVIASLLVIPVLAQPETETPTPTPTSTPTVTLTPSVTPTPTPDLYAVWTLPAESTDEPGQAVAIVYTVSAGELVNALVSFALLCTLLCLLIVYLWRNR